MISKIVAVSVLFILLASSSISISINGTNSTNWAVLIAGSNGYYNYRHQADIAHSYQILTKLGGYPSENIIVMMYNDVVNNTANPFPGQLFNEPGGIDVYGDIVVSYSGEKVTAKNFLNVIQGIKEGDTKSGPVLESGSNDNVFIYYSDHGATGLVAMPTGEPLYSTDLIKALNNMHTNGMYSQLVFYLEACESGSMFDGVLPNDTSIFATTAANPDQPSYAYYYNETLSTYMADEYSIRWMQDSTTNWDSYESIITQFNDVANVVKESSPEQYGDESFENESIEGFQAYEDRKGDNKYILNMLKNSINNLNKDLLLNSVPSSLSKIKNWRPSLLSVSSRDVKLATLQHRYLSENDLDKKILAASLVEDEIEYRINIDLLYDSLIKYITDYSNEYVDIEYNEDYINAIKYGHFKPSNENIECLKYVYNKYEKYCEKFTDYSLKYVNALVNLCQIFDDEYIISQSFQDLC